MVWYSMVWYSMVLWSSANPAPITYLSIPPPFVLTYYTILYYTLLYFTLLYLPYPPTLYTKSNALLFVLISVIQFSLFIFSPLLNIRIKFTTAEHLLQHSAPSLVIRGSGLHPKPEHTLRHKQHLK